MLNRDRVVIVTGSSSGIGLHVARAFLDGGARVVVNGRSPETLAAVVGELGAHNRVASVDGDIADASTGQRLVRAAVENFGRVDVLVNNAGTFAPRPFLEVSEAELDGYLNRNLKGTYLTTQAAVRQMKAQGGGCIVNIGTVLVDHAISGLAASAPLVSKGGIHALTINLAAELAPDGIRVNAVAPGIVRTPLHRGANIDSLGRIALLNRVGEADEIAEGVRYLCDAEFVTGHILRVDGGFVTGRAA